MKRVNGGVIKMITVNCYCKENLQSVHLFNVSQDAAHVLQELILLGYLNEKSTRVYYLVPVWLCLVRESRLCKLVPYNCIQLLVFQGAFASHAFLVLVRPCSGRCAFCLLRTRVVGSCSSQIDIIILFLLVVVVVVFQSIERVQLKEF